MPIKTDRRFRKSERLRLRSDFSRVFAYRHSAGNDVFVVYAMENGLKWSRLGMSVSKKVGNSVVRHRVRRKIREAYRINKANLPIGYDLICIARPQATRRDIDVAAVLCKTIKQAVRCTKKPRKKT